MNTSSLRLAIITCTFVAVISGVARAADGGTTISVPKDSPAFKITLPAGWSCADPVTMDSTFSWSGDPYLTGQFAKLGEMSDATAAKKKATDEAKTFLSVGAEGTAPEPTVEDAEIAGHPGFKITAKYTGSGKAKVLHLFAFAPDGKNYYEVVVQCPEASNPADDIDSMVGSLSAAQ